MKKKVKNQLQMLQNQLIYQQHYRMGKQLLLAMELNYIYIKQFLKIVKYFDKVLTILTKI